MYTLRAMTLGFRQFRWLILMVAWGALTLSSSNKSKDGDDDGGGAMVAAAGCTGCAGAAAVKGGVLKGCTTSGAKLAAAKVGGGAAAGGVGIKKTIERVGENYLMGMSKYSIGKDSDLLASVPDLKGLVSSRKSVEEFLNENPDVRYKVGQYLAEKDYKLFVSSSTLRKSPDLSGVGSKLKNGVHEVTDDFALSINSYPPPIPRDVLLSKLRASAIKSDQKVVSVSSDGGFAEIRFKDNSSEVVVKFDLVALGAGAGASSITYEVRQKKRRQEVSEAVRKE